MSTFTMKRGDRRPIVTSTLTDASGAVNLTGASVQFIMRLGSVVKVSAAATITDAAAGAVSYAWAVGDTDTTGIWLQEWEVTFSDGTVATFPNDRFNYVSIQRDLAGAA